MQELAAIIQARRGSSRLPDKIMKNILAKPMLYRVLERVQHSKLVSRIYLATTDCPEDAKLADIASSFGIKIFFGNENDVLDRYYQAAKKFKVKNIVRITADCPLIDPKVIDYVANTFLEGKYEYASNVHPPTFPDGLDTEIFTFEALEKAWMDARLKSEREHVTPYIWKNPDLFRIQNVLNKDGDTSHLRWTVDVREDLVFVRKVYRHIYSSNHLFDYSDIINLINTHPELSTINKGRMRDEGYQKSLRMDRT
jgi:spore coat polysaccharide biosynthesis protein SpsF